MAEIIEAERKLTSEALSRCTSILLSGGVLIYPTDTVYGLGCDPFNGEAVNRVFEIKGRNDKPLPILTTSLEAARRIVVVPPEATDLAVKFWPGALTLVLPRREERLEAVAPKRKSLAVRVPDSYIARQLCESIGGYLVGTSANITNQPPPAHDSALNPELVSRVDLVIHAGKTSQTRPSTIVSFENGKARILREGAIPTETIMPYIGKLA